MNQNTDLQIVESLKCLVRKSIFYSKQAHDAALAEKENLPAALAYLQRASSKMAAAEALYWAQYEILARDEAEKIFSLFDIFADELVEDFATNHSQQWTDIEYNRLIEKVNDSAFSAQNY